MSREEVLSIVRDCATYALAAPDAPSRRLYMLSWGLTHFNPKLTPGDAVLLQVEVEALAAAAEEVGGRWTNSLGYPEKGLRSRGLP